jgi:hypothetical protein
MADIVETSAPDEPNVDPNKLGNELGKAPHNYKDIAWKNTIVIGLPNFLQVVMPEAYHRLDFSGHISNGVDKTLLVNNAGTDTGKLIADLVFEIPWLDKKKSNLILLVEQQGYKSALFTKRVFESVKRLEDLNPDNEVAALVVYTDNALNEKLFIKESITGTHTLSFSTFHVPSLDLVKLNNDPLVFSRIFEAARLASVKSLSAETKAKMVFDSVRKYGSENVEESEPNSAKKLGEILGYTELQQNNIWCFAKQILKINDDNVSSNFKEKYKMELRSFTYIDVIAEEKARKEVRKERLAIAKKMLFLNIPIDQIVIVTGLKEKEILSVQQAQKSS